MQEKIRERLGWLHVADTMYDRLSDLRSFTDQIMRDGFTQVVLLGMGGSSLAPEVLAMIFGAAPGHPQLLVVDTTSPRAIHSVCALVDFDRTLFIIASKSGTTTETLALEQYFFERIRTQKGDATGRQFVSITDPGQALAVSSEQRGYRRVFLNFADIGGRYSALSYFGLVPAALLGVDLKLFIERAQQEMALSMSGLNNAAYQLGSVLGTLAKHGRDKLTLVLSPDLRPLGAWIEQLVAESLGKDGVSIVPIDTEPLGAPEVYGQDRLFVSVSAGTDRRRDGGLDALARAGHPVVRWCVNDRYDTAAEFFRWEFATAVAGAVLRVNPFDEPNVAESKEATRSALVQWENTGELFSEPPLSQDRWLVAFGSGAMFDGCATIESCLTALVRSIVPGDYFTILAYLAQEPSVDECLHDLRRAVGRKLCVATTIGYGPRYLHSTGQLHKGGPNNGAFLQLTCTPDKDLAIPTAPYSFGVLHRAQALGDFTALQDRSRRVLCVHLGSDVDSGLESLRRRLYATLGLAG